MNAIIPLVLDTLSSAALIFFAAVGLTLVFNVLGHVLRRRFRQAY